MNFDNYLFRAHSIGHIMGGVPKPLSQSQIEEYEALKVKMKGVVKPLSESQEKDYHAWKKRYDGEGKPLSEPQKEKFLKMDKRFKGIPEPPTEAVKTKYYGYKAREEAKIYLTDGAKKWLEQLVWEELTGRRNIIKNKYLDKGIMSEEQSITLYSELRNQLNFKNTERKTNDYFTGECDLARYKVRDIKTSWGFPSFPMLAIDIPTKNYAWQLDVYMDLFDYKRSELIYCLVDTPAKLIEDELRRMDWKLDIFDNEGNARPECIPLIVEEVTNHIFTFKGLEAFCNHSTSVHIEWFENFKEIPVEMRVKIFKQDRSDTRTQQLKDMVTLARQHMNDVVENIGANAMLLTSLNDDANGQDNQD